MTVPTTEAVQEALVGVTSDLENALPAELAEIAEELDALTEALGSTVLATLRDRVASVRASLRGPVATAVRDATAALVLRDEEVREAIESH